MGNRCSTLEASGTKGRVAVEEGRAGTWDKDGGDRIFGRECF